MRERETNESAATTTSRRRRTGGAGRRWPSGVRQSVRARRGREGEDCSARSQSHRLRLGHRRPRTDPSGRAGAPCQGPGPPLPRTGPGGARRRRTGTPSATATDGRAGGRGDLGRYFIHLPVTLPSFLPPQPLRMPRSRSFASERASATSTLGTRYDARRPSCLLRPRRRRSARFSRPWSWRRRRRRRRPGSC